VSADIHLPNYRRMYLQVLKDPARPWALVRLSEPENAELSHCDDVAIFENGAPIQLAVRTHGGSYLTGRLPIHALEVLASTPDASITVCAARWQLGLESREQVQAFLDARRELLNEPDDSDASAAPSSAPAPDAPAAAPTDGAAPPSAPTAPSAPPASPAPATPKPHAVTPSGGPTSGGPHPQGGGSAPRPGQW
jgi:hypothetical protein